jgi:serine protease Do
MDLLYNRYKNAVVAISTQSIVLQDNIRSLIVADGSGFFIDDKHIVTNAHVVLLQPGVLRDPPSTVENFSKFQVITITINSDAGTFKYPSILVGVDSTSDIAVLEILEYRSPIFLRWGRSRSQKSLDPIMNISNELGYGITVTTGRIRDSQFVFPNSAILPELVTCDITTNYGSSGSPIINMNGEVIAVVTSTIKVNLVGVEDSINITYGYTLAISEYSASIIVSLILSGIRTEVVEDDIELYLRVIKTSLNSRGTFIRSDFNIDITGDYNKLGGWLVDSTNQVLGYDNLIRKGDIITSIQGQNIGLYQDTLPNSSILLEVTPGDYINVSYRKMIDNYKIEYETLLKTVKFDVKNDKLTVERLTTRTFKRGFIETEGFSLEGVIERARRA